LRDREIALFENQQPQPLTNVIVLVEGCVAEKPLEALMEVAAAGLLGIQEVSDWVHSDKC
jgi:hypothetical protein